MHLPDDVCDALEADGVYRAPIRPTDGDRELVHHLCAIVATAHAFPPSGGGKLSPLGRAIVRDVHDALDKWFEQSDEGVPDRLEQEPAP